MCQHKNHSECQSDQPIEMYLLSDEEMLEVKGGGLWKVLEKIATSAAVADAAHNLGGWLGTKYGEAVTDTSGGTITTPSPSTSTSYWQCGQSPCICGACGQSGGNGPWF